jgi:hypothetical protein
MFLRGATVWDGLSSSVAAATSGVPTAAGALTNVGAMALSRWALLFNDLW